MRILDRYIARTVVGGTGIALLIILGLDIFFNIISESADLGRGNYRVPQLLQYIGMGIPESLVEFFPMAALIGTLASLGLLASGSELVVARASGLSVAGILRPVLLAGFVMLVLVVLVGELITPFAKQHAQRLRTGAIYENVIQGQQGGLWLKEGNRFVNVGNVHAGGQFSDITIFEFDDNKQLKHVLHAERLVFSDGLWFLYEISESGIEGDAVHSGYRQKQVRDTLIPAEMLEIVITEPENMPIMTLHQYIGYMEDNQLDTSRYRYAFWLRVFSPLASLVMIFLAVTIVLGLFRHAGTGKRLFAGMLAGLVFYLLNQLLAHLVFLYGISPVLSALGPALFFLLSGMVILRYT